MTADGLPHQAPTVPRSPTQPTMQVLTTAPPPHRHRPCHERLDAAYICRSTALLCPRTRSWPTALSRCGSTCKRSSRRHVTSSPQVPDAEQIAIRFDRNSAFHYLDAGRYLMAQILLHVLRLLAQG